MSSRRITTRIENGAIKYRGTDGHTYVAYPGLNYYDAVSKLADFEDACEAKPIIEYLDGWKCDINKCRTVEDLPKAAYDYVKYIEKAVGCPIKYISVGASREDYIEVK